MKNIPLLLLSFDLPLQLYEVPAFRGAMLAQCNPVEAMHNHQPPEKAADKYAVVQYKSIRRKAAVLMLDRGIAAAPRLMSRMRWQISLRGREQATTAFATESQKNYKALIGTTEKLQNYRIRNWLPLNQKQFAHYQESSRMKNRIGLLEERLASHLHAFATGMECQLEYPVEAHILDSNFFRQKEVAIKQKRFLSFNLDFETNFNLPPYVGLGAKTAFGYGMVEKLKR